MRMWRPPRRNMRALTVAGPLRVHHGDIALIARVVMSPFDQLARWALSGESVPTISIWRNPIFVAQTAVKPSPGVRKIRAEHMILPASDHAIRAWRLKA